MKTQQDSDGVKELVRLFKDKHDLSPTMFDMLAVRMQAEQDLERTEAELKQLQNNYLSDSGAPLLQTWPLIAQHIRTTAPSSWDLARFPTDEALLLELQRRLPWLQSLPLGDGRLKDFESLLFGSVSPSGDGASTRASTPRRC